MRATSTLKLASIAVCFASASFAAAPPLPPQDGQTACYPSAPPKEPGLQVEVHDEFGPYRAVQSVMVSDANGPPLATVICDGPWANFRLKPGTYRVFAFTGYTQSDELVVNVLPDGSQVTLTLRPPTDQLPVPQVTEEEMTRLPPPPPDLADEIAASR